MAMWRPTRAMMGSRPQNIYSAPYGTRDYGQQAGLQLTPGGAGAGFVPGRGAAPGFTSPGFPTTPPRTAAAPAPNAASLFSPPNYPTYPTTPGAGYYAPGAGYGTNTDQSTTPFVNGPAGYLAQNPQAAYARYTAPFASGEDPFSKFVRSQYGQAYQGFQGALATNPNLNFYNQYLASLGGQNFFQQRFMAQPAAARGEQSNLLGGGRMRWFNDRLGF